ncbi:MAG: hypothetical protein L0241_17765 [Planctomycetia bacterium]|nr:hypothetical protein [Planctomycetia bacterium]
MTGRIASGWCLLLGFVAVIGCESIRSSPPSAAPPALSTTVATPKSVEILRTSATQPQPPPPVEDDPLVLVADCLKRSDFAEAAKHLEAYVRAHPDQLMFREQLAELYFRANKPADAKFHFEKFIADAQAGPVAVQAHLVHCHTKLMEIAQSTSDEFGELFHRGVGLLLLVKEPASEKDRDEAFCEEMLCKAIRALLEAKEIKPHDPRVRLYLAEAHDRANNRRAADAERTATRTGVVSGELTATERKQVLLRE